MKISKLTRREREKILRYNDILGAAEKRFFEKGYDGVSMDDIAGDLELSKTTLYLYFKNKPSLYFAVVIKGMVILRDVFKDAVKNKTTGLGKITNIIRAYFDYIQKYSDYYRLNVSTRAPRFAKMLLNNKDGDTKIESSEEYIGLTEELFRMLMEAVNLGIKDATIRKDLDSIQTVMFLGSTIERMVNLSPENQSLLEMYGITAEAYLQHSIDVLLHGIEVRSKELE